MELMPPEQVALQNAFGRELANDIAARRTQPPHAVSAMDGYAVRANDVQSTPTKLTIVGEVPAGQAFKGNIGKRETVRIFTGAKIPDGADSIVIQENAKADRTEVNIIEGQAPVGRFIRPAGLDFREGDILIHAGKVLTARDIGLAAGMNITSSARSFSITS